MSDNTLTPMQARDLGAQRKRLVLKNAARTLTLCPPGREYMLVLYEPCSGSGAAGGINYAAPIEGRPPEFDGNDLNVGGALFELEQDERFLAAAWLSGLPSSTRA